MGFVRGPGSGECAAVGLGIRGEGESRRRAAVCGGLAVAAARPALARAARCG